MTGIMIYTRFRSNLSLNRVQNQYIEPFYLIYNFGGLFYIVERWNKNNHFVCKIYDTGCEDVSHTLSSFVYTRVAETARERESGKKI